MKTLARIAAGLSFTSFFLGGMTILTKVDPRSPDAAIVTVLGLFLLGIAFFAGPMLWLAGEKCCSNSVDK